MNTPYSNSRGIEGNGGRTSQAEPMAMRGDNTRPDTSENQGAMA